jgi:hypothetical protein
VVVINDVQSAAWASDNGYRESVHKLVPLVSGNLMHLGHLASDLYHSKPELRWAQLNQFYRSCSRFAVRGTPVFFLVNVFTITKRSQEIRLLLNVE